MELSRERVYGLLPTAMSHRDLPSVPCQFPGVGRYQRFLKKAKRRPVGVRL